MVNEQWITRLRMDGLGVNRRLSTVCTSMINVQPALFVFNSG